MEKRFERVAITAGVIDLICVALAMIVGVFEQGSTFQYQLLAVGVGVTVIGGAALIISLIIGFRSIRPKQPERRS